MKHNLDVALKISKKQRAEVENAAVEAKLLKKILGEDPDRHGIVKMLDFFPFRHHFVIVFEFLDINLYKYIKQPGFKTFDRLLLKKVAV
jgi:serine/threonine protein kinase